MRSYLGRRLVKFLNNFRSLRSDQEVAREALNECEA